MADDKFPYHDCTWHQNDEISERWLVALEKTGPENVRMRLAQTDAGSRGNIPIGREMTMTIGFAQEWLAWRDRLKSERDIARHERQIWWTRTAALAAGVAAVSAAIGWAWTILHPH
jgi:hypothetical protein